MATTLLTALGALALATTLGAQAPTPATQPVRPPDPAPTRPRTPPLAPPEPDLGSNRDRSVVDRDRDRDAGTPDAGTLTLQGCVHRLPNGAFRLLPVAGNDATVTEEVRLGGSASPLRAAVGRVAEVRGRYEQTTPATTASTFRVDRVKPLATACPSR